MRSAATAAAASKAAAGTGARRRIPLMTAPRRHRERGSLLRVGRNRGALLLPVVEVPPLDVAGGELDLCGALVRRLAVHVVEPGELLTGVLLDTFDARDELATRVGLDVGHPVERAHGRLVRRDPR